jgi:valyl-tRNA synthetase
VECSIKVTGDDATLLEAHASLLEPLANLKVQAIASDTEKPDDAAVALIGDCEIYLHGLVDADEEKKRVEKAISEKEKSINALKGRLSNEKYVSKAPEKLVQETRDQLATFEKELEALKEQLAGL